VAGGDRVDPVAQLGACSAKSAPGVAAALPGDPAGERANLSLP
jgi:hypothetical protein